MEEKVKAKIFFTATSAISTAAVINAKAGLE
jgi:hypothetical protein